VPLAVLALAALVAAARRRAASAAGEDSVTDNR